MTVPEPGATAKDCERCRAPEAGGWVGTTQANCWKGQDSLGKVKGDKEAVGNAHRIPEGWEDVLGESAGKAGAAPEPGSASHAPLGVAMCTTVRVFGLYCTQHPGSQTERSGGWDWRKAGRNAKYVSKYTS